MCLDFICSIKSRRSLINRTKLLSVSRPWLWVFTFNGSCCDLVVTFCLAQTFVAQTWRVKERRLTRNKTPLARSKKSNFWPLRPRNLERRLSVERRLFIPLEEQLLFSEELSFTSRNILCLINYLWNNTWVLPLRGEEAKRSHFIIAILCIVVTHTDRCLVSLDGMTSVLWRARVRRHNH